MDAKAVKAWHEKLTTHPDNSKPTLGVREVDESQRIARSPRRARDIGRLIGADQFSARELKSLVASSASEHAPEESGLISELKEEIRRRNR